VNKVFEAFQDAFNKRLIEVAKDADMPTRTNITIGLIQTKPMESYGDWWAVRAYILAVDKDKMAFDISMGERLSMRLN
jgi:hypothetical protein